MRLAWIHRAATRPPGSRSVHATAACAILLIAPLCPAALCTDNDSAGLPGFTQPQRHVVLNAQRSGRVQTFAVEEGALAPSGSVLVELVDEAQTARLARARIAAESTLPILIATAEAAWRTRELDRLTGLRGNSATPKEIEDARHAAELAALKLQEARWQHALAQADYEVEQRAHAQLTLHAPMPAYVVKRLAAAGEVVAAGDPLLELAQLDALKIEVDCPLPLVSRLAPGAEVTVAPEHEGWATRKGRVALISRAADAASQTTRVVIRVDNADNGWLAGMRVTVRLPEPSQAHAAKREPDVR